MNPAKEDEKIGVEKLEQSVGYSLSQLRSPETRDERILRRALVWALFDCGGFTVEDIQSLLGIKARQSVFRILRTKTLCEEEYNWRKSLMKKWPSSIRRAA